MLPTKKSIFVCVPVIFLTIVAFLMNVHYALMAVVAVGMLWFYLRLSTSLFVAMMVFMVICMTLVHFFTCEYLGVAGDFCDCLDWSVYRT